jgi:hypothetical protein
MAEQLRVGCIARIDETGLGNQALEFVRHMHPAVVVAVDFSRLPDAMTQHRGRFPDSTLTTWRGVGFHFDNPAALEQLATCDVIFSIETFYDQRVAQLPVPSILYVNPELFRGYGAPTYWAPTSWLLDQLPNGTRVMPWPVATDRPYRRGTGLLHVAGRNASYDRNGTVPAAEAARRTGQMLNVMHQSADLPSIKGIRRMGTVDSYWDLYAYGSVLVMPRRYGGMCLPVQEALAAGLPVVMTDTEPNRDWPVRLVKATAGKVRTVASYPIPTADVDIDALVDALRDIDRWAEANRAAQADWVAAHSWDTLLPVWQQALKEAAK